jgi:AraC-like DNA-binding protein
MSTFQFARIFQILIGTSPHEYLLSVRYRAALQMLLDGTSVTEACFETGFTNLSHFTRQFKTRFGRSPSTARTWSPEFVRPRLMTPLGTAAMQRLLS